MNAKLVFENGKVIGVTLGNMSTLIPLQNPERDNDELRREAELYHTLDFNAAVETEVQKRVAHQIERHKNAVDGILNILGENDLLPSCVAIG